ncbi:DNA polymerase III subunit beta [Bacteroidota bacterium]
MKFVVSSQELLDHLQLVSRVISTRNTLPILDNFLFELTENQLVVTASDLETTLTTSISLENTEGQGKIALAAKIITDTLKEFPDQPLTFDVNNETLSVEIISENGKFNLVGHSGNDFPQIPEIKKESSSKILLKPNVLLNGISKTLFATADDELRPVMNGIFIELEPENLKFVASDAHKLVRYTRLDAASENSASFILPKKPASLLKNILVREDENVSVEFDDKNAVFTLTEYKLVCRLVEGNYPSYESVIPKDNPNLITINRIDFYNTLKRVSVFSNQASNLVKLNLKGNQLVISAQDIDFSISAVEKLPCQYVGDDMEIGFKSAFLQEILSSLSSDNVRLELSDPTRAGILLPSDTESEDEDILMLLMPMMINV